MDCEKMETYRNYDLIDKDILDPEERMRTLLFRNNRFQETGEMIKNLWFKRKYLLGDYREKEKKKDKKGQKGQNLLQRVTPSQGLNLPQGQTMLQLQALP